MHAEVAGCKVIGLSVEAQALAYLKSIIEL
jgi:hypothetical protein